MQNKTLPLNAYFSFLNTENMGTWGYNYFESDAAFDYMDDIENTDDPKDMIEDIFDEAIAGEYLDFDTGSAVIVAAAYVDRQLNGTRYSEPEIEDPLAVDSFATRHPDVDLATLRGAAVEALRKVQAEGSELLELWQENEAELPAWRQKIDELIARLESVRPPLRII